jgi:hypothetical protein
MTSGEGAQRLPRCELGGAERGQGGGGAKKAAAVHQHLLKQSKLNLRAVADRRLLFLMRLKESGSGQLLKAVCKRIIIN